MGHSLEGVKLKIARAAEPLEVLRTECSASTQKGTLVNPSNLRKRSFAPLLETAGLPSIRFHDLRHTCATLLLTSNVNPKIVSEMLGHATIAITLDTYSHVLPNMQGGATRALEDMLR
jgi:integrase